MPDYDALEQRRSELAAKRKAAKKKRRAKTAKRILILFIIAAILAVLVLSLTVFFPIKNISVKGNTLYTTEQIIKASGIEEGKNLFLAGIGAEADICTELPYIATAKVSRKLPANIVITVEPAKAVYCYRVGNIYLLCDINNKVLQSVNDQPEGVIGVIGSTAKNTKAGKTVTFEQEDKNELFKTIITALQQNEITVNSVNISQKVNIVLRVEGRFNVELGSTAHLEAKVKHLSGMINQTEKDRVGTIDLSDYSPENPTGILTRE